MVSVSGQSMTSWKKVKILHNYNGGQEVLLDLFKPFMHRMLNTGQIKENHCMKCIPVPIQSNSDPLSYSASKKEMLRKIAFWQKGTTTCTRSMKELAPALAATEYWAAFCVKATVCTIWTHKATVCTLPHTVALCTLPHNLKKSCFTLWREVALPVQTCTTAPPSICQEYTLSLLCSFSLLRSLLCADLGVKVKINLLRPKVSFVNPLATVNCQSTQTQPPTQLQ